VIVYGTLRDAGANRYVAEQMQSRFLDEFESRVPIYKDFEATNDLLHNRDVIFVGRPEANSALALWTTQLGLDYTGAVFRLNDKVYASERDGLIFAARNPLNASHMVLIVGGNDALTTVKLQKADLPDTQYLILQESGESLKGFIRHVSPAALNPAAPVNPASN